MHAITGTMFVAALMGGPPGLDTRLLRSQFEVGVRYDDAAVAATASHCLADDWSVVLDWGDGSGAKPPTRREAPQVPCGGSGCVPQGASYLLWTDHVFERVGRFTVRIEPRIHCFSAHGGAVPFPAAFEVSVHGRVPIKKLEVRQSSLRLGETTAVRILLTAPAPPSGTRVYLRSGPHAFADAIALPSFVDVRPGATNKVVELVAKGPVGTGWIEASTTPGGWIKRTLQIRAR